MMRSLGIVATLLVICAFGAGYFIGRPSPVPGVVVWSTGPTIEHLEALRELVVTKVSVSDILTAEDPGYRGSWLVKGDALISIDLHDAKVLDTSQPLRTATIQLPEPRILSPRVDFERTMTWDISRSSWVPWKGDQDKMRDQAMLHAQRLVAHVANSDEYIDGAKRSAERIIKTAYQMVDWRVTVQWKESESSEPQPSSQGQ
jgi:hypothetical protein